MWFYNNNSNSRNNNDNNVTNNAVCVMLSDSWQEEGKVECAMKSNQQLIRLIVAVIC